MSEPVNNAITTITESGWYYLDETTGCYHGCYVTRETALKKARKRCEDNTKPIILVKGYQPPIQISGCIWEDEIGDLLLKAEQTATDLYGCEGDISFDCSDEQKDDLLELIRKAFDEWQVKNSIAVNSNIIETEREETVLPDGTITAKLAALINDDFGDKMLRSLIELSGGNYYGEGLSRCRIGLPQEDFVHRLQSAVSEWQKVHNITVPVGFAPRAEKTHEEEA